MRSKLNLSTAKLLGCLAIVFVLQSCGGHKRGVWQNEKMNASRREDMHELNKTVFDCLKDNKYQELQMSMSRELLDNKEMIRTVETMYYNLKKNKYALQNEYYVNSPPETSVTIGDRKAGLNNFDLNFRSVADEMYFSFFVSDSPTEKWMIAAIFAKYDYGWKLRDITLSPYTTQGKTSPELFKLAQQKYDKGYLIDAVNLMDLAQNFSMPADEWQYTFSRDMGKFHSKVIDEANDKYHFPYTIDQVKTHPQIIRVYNQKAGDGYVPMVYYLSKVSLKDTMAVKRENAEVQKVIGQVMPGIDKDKKYLMYAAFNQRPNPKVSVDHFDMMVKLP